MDEELGRVMRSLQLWKRISESEKRLKQYADYLEILVEERSSQLRINEERLRSFLDSALDTFWLYSPELGYWI